AASPRVRSIALLGGHASELPAPHLKVWTDDNEGLWILDMPPQGFLQIREGLLPDEFLREDAFPQVVGKLRPDPRADARMLFPPPRRRYDKLDPAEKDAERDHREAGRALNRDWVPRHAEQAVMIDDERGSTLPEHHECYGPDSTDLREDEREGKDDDETTHSADIEGPGNARRKEVCMQ